MSIMTVPMTADAFAAQLRAAGCRVQIDRSFAGAVYLQASKADDLTTVTIVFEGDRFKRAFAAWVGVSRRRWPKFRTMKAVRSFLGADNPKAGKPRTLRRDQLDCGYVTSDGRYKATPAYSPTHMGGSTSRPSYWTLTDLRGEYETRTRPLLSDIRDILKERP